MVKSLILVRELMTGKDSHSIYFANDDLAVEMIDFLKARFHFINEYENESAKKAGMRNWMVYYGANKTPCMISLVPIACKDYNNQAVKRKCTWQYAAVAQLDRVFGYEPKGRGFESLQPYQLVASDISLATSFFISLQSSSRAH